MKIRINTKGYIESMYSLYQKLLYLVIEKPEESLTPLQQVLVTRFLRKVLYRADEILNILRGAPPSNGRRLKKLVMCLIIIEAI